MFNSGPQIENGMANVVTKKVRLSEAEARKLRRLARSGKTTESGVLRRGIALVAEERQREWAIEELISFIDGPEPKKVPLRMR